MPPQSGATFRSAFCPQSKRYLDYRRQIALRRRRLRRRILVYLLSLWERWQVRQRDLLKHPQKLGPPLALTAPGLVADLTVEPERFVASQCSAEFEHHLILTNAAVLGHAARCPKHVVVAPLCACPPRRRDIHARLLSPANGTAKLPGPPASTLKLEKPGWRPRSASAVGSVAIC